MALRRPGFPAKLSSSCDVFERAARHEQSIVTAESPASALLRRCVRRARIAASLTLEGAALDAGVSVDTIKRWERGSASPKVDKLLDAPKLGPHFRAQWDLAFGGRRAA
jgi:DNA-binding XRE family transcriptional regulator